MAYWAKPPLPHNQVLTFHPKVEDLVAEDHPVRLYREILWELRWTGWEARYHGGRGQPPIHPRYIPGAILHGVALCIRSSRQLEDARG